MADKTDSRISVKAAPRRNQISLLFVITSMKLAKTAEQMLEDECVPLVYRSNGRGTASSEMMDMLGLTGVDRCIMICMLSKLLADDLLKKLRKLLRLGMVNTGVAFTIPVSGASVKMLRLIERVENKENSDADNNAERSEKKMEESMYALIVTIVDRGCSEEVMKAARTNGATGGTVISSRLVGAGKEAMRFFGISIQSEREMVLILADKSEKKNIMKAIGESCGMQSEAHGMVMSLPVDSVAGIG